MKPKNVVITIRLTQADTRRLDQQLAKMRKVNRGLRISRQDVIRKALLQYLDRRSGP